MLTVDVYDLVPTAGAISGILLYAGLMWNVTQRRKAAFEAQNRDIAVLERECETLRTDQDVHTTRMVAAACEEERKLAAIRAAGAQRQIELLSADKKNIAEHRDAIKKELEALKHVS